MIHDIENRVRIFTSILLLCCKVLVNLQNSLDLTMTVLYNNSFMISYCLLYGSNTLLLNEFIHNTDKNWYE